MSNNFIEIEIRLLKKEAAGYPIELNDETNHRQFRGGYLASDITNWTPTASPTDDGKKLLAALLGHPETKQAWDRVRGATKSPRRLRLSIDATAPELHALPWELLYDDTMLAADEQTPFSRYLAGEWEVTPPEKSRPIKMLIAIANPTNLGNYQLQAVDFAAEQTLLESAFEDFTQGQIERVYLPQPITLTALAEALKQGYHLLHIVAHGMFNKRRGEAALFLGNVNNEVEHVFESDFSNMVQRLAQKPQLVFLATCQSATRNPAEAFRGFAPRLITAGVPTVLAMQDLVPVETARAFSRVFYRELFRHGQVDLASNQARAALLTAKLDGGTIPVLFSRLPDNKLLQEIDPDLLPIIERKAFEPETVLIPSGPFIMGNDDPDMPSEGPRHVVTLPTYRMGKYPVTNQQYGEYLKDIKEPRERNNRKPRYWFGLTPAKEQLEHPVVGISWFDALAYTEWLSQVTGRNYRLPSEAQWEKAARGPEGQLYPWGNEWQEDYCNGGQAATRRSGRPKTSNKLETTPVGQYPQGASPYGCLDMTGNVCEWTTTMWGDDPMVNQFPYPYQLADDRDKVAAEWQDARWQRILRGGNFSDEPTRLRCSSRFQFAPDRQAKNWGFRVVCEVG